MKRERRSQFEARMERVEEALKERGYLRRLVMEGIYHFTSHLNVQYLIYF